MRAAGGAGEAGAYALTDLQAYLQQFPASHYSAGGREPLLYATVLLLSLQFRAAVAFLARDGSARDFRADAVHLALALAHHQACAAFDFYFHVLLTPGLIALHCEMGVLATHTPFRARPGARRSASDFALCLHHHAQLCPGLICVCSANGHAGHAQSCLCLMRPSPSAVAPLACKAQRASCARTHHAHALCSQ
jgi:hypothetical protein